MSRKNDAEVVREVTACIEAAIAKNRRQEWIVVGVLLALFTTGLSLLVYGAVSQIWALLASGGLVQVTIAFPVYRLIQLREDNMRLQILPQLMRLAETNEAKVLAAQLVRRLIEKV
ncbi:hypothetical protein GobsT_20000 [Gemmata obscuriglobus]|nr:hypothetical protein GobsT_20000 [Gemmata obscuriglobus]VTS04006.1 unnamed protein product [Gemmata obscuriglobus UQM 2246]